MAFWGKKGDEEKKLPGSGDTLPGFAGSSPVPTPTAQPISKELPEFFNSIAATKITSEESKVRSALGPGTVIQGKLSFDSTVSIDGKLNGEVFSSKTLIVGKSGIVDAVMEVSSLIVRGIVKGTIKATEQIEIKDGGQLLGDVTTPVLIMEEGCIFNGSCSMGEGSKKAARV